MSKKYLASKIYFIVVMLCGIAIFPWAVTRMIVADSAASVHGATRYAGTVLRLDCKYSARHGIATYFITLSSGEVFSVRRGRASCDEEFMQNAVGQSFVGFYVAKAALEVSIGDEVVLTFQDAKAKTNFSFLALSIGIVAIFLMHLVLLRRAVKLDRHAHTL